MKIGFISDTHGCLADTKKALEYLKDCKYIIHTGDVLNHGPRNGLPQGYDPKELSEVFNSMKNIYFVKGNCDSDVDNMIITHDLTKKRRVFSLKSLKIYGIHGYEETESQRIEMAKKAGCRIVVSGHTHVKVLKKVDDIVVLNPGSTTFPKDDSKSIAILEDNLLSLIELDTGKIIKSIEI